MELVTGLALLAAAVVARELRSRRATRHRIERRLRDIAELSTTTRIAARVSLMRVARG